MEMQAGGQLPEKITPTAQGAGALGDMAAEGASDGAIGMNGKTAAANFAKAAGPLAGMVGGIAGSKDGHSLGGALSGLAVGHAADVLADTLAAHVAPKWRSTIGAAALPASFLAGAGGGRGYSALKDKIIGKEKKAEANFEKAALNSALLGAGVGGALGAAGGALTGAPHSQVGPDGQLHQGPSHRLRNAAIGMGLGAGVGAGAGHLLGGGEAAAKTVAKAKPKAAPAKAAPKKPAAKAAPAKKAPARAAQAAPAEEPFAVRPPSADIDPGATAQALPASDTLRTGMGSVGSAPQQSVLPALSPRPNVPLPQKYNLPALSPRPQSAAPAFEQTVAEAPLPYPGQVMVPNGSGRGPVSPGMRAMAQQGQAPAVVPESGVRGKYSPGFVAHLQGKEAGASAEERFLKSAQELFSKEAAKPPIGFGTMALNMVKKNPAAVGAGVGAVGGAIAGGPDHRLSGAAGGAAFGAGAAHAGTNIVGSMTQKKNPMSFGKAMGAYGDKLQGSATAGLDRARTFLNGGGTGPAKAPPPAAAPVKRVRKAPAQAVAPVAGTTV
jgi:hypothetical protein